MSDRRRIRRALLVAALALGVGIALPAALPSARVAYVEAFHAQANLALRSFGPERGVRLSAPRAVEDPSDTRMVGFERSRMDAVFEAHFSIFWRAYAPQVAFAALVLGTPIERRRRWLAALTGIALLQLLAIGLTALLAQAAFGSASAAGSEGADRLSRIARELFNQELPRAIVVLLLWALLCQPGRAFATRSGGALR
jgi:hypothetical protein